MDSLLWVLTAGLMVLGVLGTVLPVLPGTALVLAGVILGAWIDDFVRVNVGTVVLIGVLAVLAWVLEWAAGLLAGMLAKVVLAFTMVGVFIAALVW